MERRRDGAMRHFFVTSDAIDGKTVLFTGENANHIAYSLRMKRGDTVIACTPDSKLYTCELTDFTGDGVLAHVESISECDTEPPYKVRLYQAIPKGDKLESVVQKSVECGVYSVTPFESSRCIAKYGADCGKKIARLQRISAEAANQCGRGIIPEIKPPLSFEEMIGEAALADVPIFCYEGNGTEPIGRVLARGGETFSVVVGAEGGFSEEEARIAVGKGMIPVGLGSRILRCETAAPFVLACISLVKELS